MDGNLTLELSILTVLLILLRVFFLMHKITTGHTRVHDRVRNDPAKTLICIGSGGHTTEMLTLISSLDFERYTPRTYIIARTDTTSLNKIDKLEEAKAGGHTGTEYEICEIPRSRVVQQSYLTSVLTTIYSTLYCIPLMLKLRPELVLCNGPGTCVPICMIAFLMKAAFISDNRIVFVESFCRTKTFSLTGKILIYVADNILVQWPSLKRKLKRADYVGQLL